MKPIQLCLCLISISACCLASSITTGTVSTQAGASPFCGDSNTTGALIVCNSSFLNEGGLAEASANASLPGVSIHTLAASTAAGSAVANARAQFDEFVVIIGGMGSGMVIGQYAYNFRLSTDYNFSGGTSSLEITQGDAFRAIPGDTNSGLAMLTSAFTVGVPFEVMLNVRSHSSASGHEVETTDGSVALLGFTDANGHPLTFTVIPEPSALSLSLAGGLLFGAMAMVRTRRPSRGPRKESYS